MVLKLGRFGEEIRSAWEVLKYGAGDHFDHRVKNEESRRKGHCVGTAYYNTLRKGRVDEEEYVSSYWMALRKKREVTENSKRKH